jgi:uncharacterized protein (TIGR03067 family)
MNRWLLTTVCALGALMVPAPGWIAKPEVLGQEKNPHVEELAALQGTWKVLRFEEGGKRLDDGIKRTWVIDGHKITLMDNGKAILERKMKIDPTRNPKHLDMHAGEEHTDSAIYVRAGDYMIMCANRPCVDGKKRPTEFASGTEQGGVYLIVWKIER